MKGRLSFANVMSCLAVFIALGGGGWAVSVAQENSVTSQSIRRGAVRTADVKDQNFTGTDVAGDSLTGEDIPPRLFSEVLPSGQTVRGIYGTRYEATFSNYTGMATISFGFILASAPTPHFIASGGSAALECPGNFYNPQAMPGHLCIYESSFQNRATPVVKDVNFFDNAASPFGAHIIVQSTAPGEGGSSGAWAVTAP